MRRQEGACGEGQLQEKMEKQKKLLEELPIAIFMRHQREKNRYTQKGNEKKFNYMNLHFFHEKMKLKNFYLYFFCMHTVLNFIFACALFHFNSSQKYHFISYSYI
jgi:hypothetical protein